MTSLYLIQIRPPCLPGSQNTEMAGKCFFVLAKWYLGEYLPLVWASESCLGDLLPKVSPTSEGTPGFSPYYSELFSLLEC